METSGKIIAILGAQASGKSTLVEELIKIDKRFFGFFEGEDFPEFVTRSFEVPSGRIRAFIYFHNHWMNQYFEAEKIRKDGGIAILDTYWLTNLFYLDALEDENDKRLIYDLIQSTSRFLSPPDGIIYLDVDRSTMIERVRQRARSGKRSWEKRSEWLDEAMMVKRRHSEFFGSESLNQNWLTKTRVIHVSSLDSQLVPRANGFIQSM